MKILLIGEYSRLHNSLKEGLEKLGHHVVLMGHGDYFKKYPVDLLIDSTYCNRFFPQLLRKIILKISNIDIFDIEKIWRLKKNLSKLSDFDIIQLINENALAIQPKFQIKYLKKIFEINNKVFLLSCGNDFINIGYYLKNSDKYSVLTPLLKNPSLKKHYIFTLKYITKPYQKLHKFIYNNIKGVIASDLDYHLPLLNNPYYLGLIPNPINIDKLVYKPLKIKNKITVFHGVNTNSYIRKGNIYFDEALKIITNKYPNKIKIIRTEDLPYEIYIDKYNKADIIFDQVFSLDQGYNALEAMAKGKVVFTGAEREWLDYYKLKEDTIAINALPDAEKIAEKLEWLILNPENIHAISKNARAFIEKEHDYLKIAKTYVETWSKQ